MKSQPVESTLVVDTQASKLSPQLVNTDSTDRILTMSQDNLHSRESEATNSMTISSYESRGSSSDQIKPYARLTVVRHRIYEKSCNNEAPHAKVVQRPPTTYSSSSSWGEFPATLSPPPPATSDCRFTDWSDWSTCSSTCGRGIRTRTRNYVEEHEPSAWCSASDLIEKEVCLSECLGNVTCVTRDWSSWSDCSVTCGRGTRKRFRTPIGRSKKACKDIDLAQEEPCIGSHGLDCKSEPTSCNTTSWSHWSECSVPCGK